MPNERLRNAVVGAGLSTDQLAQRVGVDPKTVERWILNDRLPHRRHRWAVARILDDDEQYLWPAAIDEARSNAANQAEFISLYPNRGAVPQQLWDALIESATAHIDVLVFAGLFLFDTRPRLPGHLASKADSGLSCRFLLGDPASRAVRQRGQEEGIAGGLAARIRTSIQYLAATQRSSGIEIRLHQTVLYNSIYRFDDDLLVNTHVHGAPASLNPVIHLRRAPGAHLFDHYMTSYERVWSRSIPLQPRES